MHMACPFCDGKQFPQRWGAATLGMTKIIKGATLLLSAIENSFPRKRRKHPAPVTQW